MNIRIKSLILTTRRTKEILEFSPTATFIYGPVGTGKSTVARLIDYCLGGTIERTPAIQKEFVAATLSINLGIHNCHLERAATDNRSVRVAWRNGDGEYESVNAAIRAGDVPLIEDEVYNLSDLLFFLCGVTPIMVRKRLRDPDSPLIRLSFRDVWWYCYLDQTQLDSSFFRLEDSFRGRKSQDAMRFFTGLHSERLSQLETKLYRTIDEQKGKREAVRQIREFMRRFDLASGFDLESQIRDNERERERAEAKRAEIEGHREVDLHPTDRLREELRVFGKAIDEVSTAVDASKDVLKEQRALRAELITAKIKSHRVQQAGTLLEGVDYKRCPKCGRELTARVVDAEHCSLCLCSVDSSTGSSSTGGEAVRRDLNERIDQVSDSIRRRERAVQRSKRELESLRAKKRQLDQRLQREVRRYDSAFVDSIRELEGEIATLVERKRYLEKLQEMPEAIEALENEAGSLQGRIDSLRREFDDERLRLRDADKRVASIAKHFKAIMRNIQFPGVAEDDEVVLAPRNWYPSIRHNGQEWNFWDAGSGGKKTLFNVCYALAVHAAGVEEEMPIPSILVIDSPTKNISEDENPELVRALYREIYRFASSGRTQFLLIDSDLVSPVEDTPHFQHRHMAGRRDAPSLIPYYKGP